MKKLSGGIRTALAQYRELARSLSLHPTLTMQHVSSLTTVESDRTAEAETVCADVCCATALVLFAAERGYLADVELSKIAASKPLCWLTSTVITLR